MTAVQSTQQHIIITVSIIYSSTQKTKCSLFTLKTILLITPCVCDSYSLSNNLTASVKSQNFHQMNPQIRQSNLMAT